MLAYVRTVGASGIVKIVARIAALCATMNHWDVARSVCGHLHLHPHNLSRQYKCLTRMNENLFMTYGRINIAVQL